MELTTEEKALLKTYLSKYEKSAKHWQTTRYLLLGLVIFLYVTGIHSVLPTVKNTFSKVNQEEIIESLGCEEIPNDVPFKYWIVGYVNKTVVRSEIRNQEQSMELFMAIIGVIHITAAIMATVFVINRWKHGKRDMVTAKAIRIHLLNQECKME